MTVIRDDEISAGQCRELQGACRVAAINERSLVWKKFYGQIGDGFGKAAKRIERLEAELDMLRQNSNLE